jgi:hypothetical protein
MSPEVEGWLGAATQGVVGVPYAIRRRPLPGLNTREVALPTQIVVDAARSKLPINPQTGAVDILVNPDGTAAPSLPYGVPSSISMGGTFFDCWLSERSDIGTGLNPQGQWIVLSLSYRTGRIAAATDPDPSNPFAAVH